jgi:hypothetical protein
MPAMSDTPINLRAFLPLVLPYAPKCPELVATFNLRLAAIEFCTRTLCWRYSVTAAITVANPALTLTANSEVAAYDYAYFEGEELTPIPLIDLQRLKLEAAGTPVYITQSTQNTLTVAPFAEGSLRVGMFLKPAMGNTYSANAGGQMQDAFDVVPTFMFSNYAEAIASGALARLCAQPETSYTSPQLAMYHAGKFERAVTDAMGISLTGQQRAPIRSVTRWC